jgi:hypothetical protein
MPHVPDLRSHDTHDLELVAAFAARDLAGRPLEDATALVAACTACAELHDDLRAISAAIPAAPAPRRRRDYRLTPEQAAALRPSGWRRFLSGLASPKLAFTAPLGTGLATLGLVGLLLAAMPGAIPLGNGDGRDGANAPAIQMNEPAEAPVDEARPEAPGEKVDPPAGGAGGAAAPTPGDVTGNGEAGAPADGRLATPPANDVRLLVVGSVLALLLGLGLVGGRMAARRSSGAG